MYAIPQLDIITQRIRQSYIKAYGNQMVSMYLYGSYARGDNREDSDIDLVAIVEGDRLDLQNRLEEVWNDAADMGLEYEVIISPTVIPKKEFDLYKDSLPYYRNIEREGIRIE